MWKNQVVVCSLISGKTINGSLSLLLSLKLTINVMRKPDGHGLVRMKTLLLLHFIEVTDTDPLTYGRFAPTAHQEKTFGFAPPPISLKHI